MAANIPYREDKIKNAVCFFASEHERLTKQAPHPCVPL